MFTHSQSQRTVPGPSQPADAPEANGSISPFQKETVAPLSLGLSPGSGQGPSIGGFIPLSNAMDFGPSLPSLPLASIRPAPQRPTAAAASPAPTEPEGVAALDVEEEAPGDHLPPLSATEADVAVAQQPVGWMEGPSQLEVAEISQLSQPQPLGGALATAIHQTQAKAMEQQQQQQEEGTRQGLQDTRADNQAEEMRDQQQEEQQSAREGIQGLSQAAGSSPRQEGDGLQHEEADVSQRRQQIFMMASPWPCPGLSVDRPCVTPASCPQGFVTQLPSGSMPMASAPPAAGTFASTQRSSPSDRVRERDDTDGRYLVPATLPSQSDQGVPLSAAAPSQQPGGSMTEGFRRGGMRPPSPDLVNFSQQLVAQGAGGLSFLDDLVAAPTQPPSPTRQPAVAQEEMAQGPPGLGAAARLSYRRSFQGGGQDAFCFAFSQDEMPPPPARPARAVAPPQQQRREAAATPIAPVKADEVVVESDEDGEEEEVVVGKRHTPVPLHRAGIADPSQAELEARLEPMKTRGELGKARRKSSSSGSRGRARHQGVKKEDEGEEAAPARPPLTLVGSSGGAHELSLRDMPATAPDPYLVPGEEGAAPRSPAVDLAPAAPAIVQPTPALGSPAAASAQVFQGIHFLLTGFNQRETEEQAALSEQIRGRGGQVLDEPPEPPGIPSGPNQSPTALSPRPLTRAALAAAKAKASAPFSPQAKGSAAGVLVVVSKIPGARTPKFLTARAADLPVARVEWVERCCSLNQRLPITGQLAWHTGCYGDLLLTPSKAKEELAATPRLLEGARVALFGSDRFASLFRSLLGYAGAIIVPMQFEKVGGSAAVSRDLGISHANKTSCLCRTHCRPLRCLRMPTWFQWS